MIPLFWQGFAIGAVVFGGSAMLAISWLLKWHHDTAVMAKESADALNKVLTAILDAKKP